mgnify:FL=1
MKKYIQVITESGIVFEFIDFNVNALALTTPEKVYFSNDLSRFSDDFALYVVLHELAHAKRVANGKAPDLEVLIDEHFGNFFEKVMIEERIAERYAQRMYLKLTGEVAPTFMTLGLERQSNVEGIAELYEMAYNQIKVSELGYYDTIRNLILTKEEV